MKLIFESHREGLSTNDKSLFTKQCNEHTKHLSSVLEDGLLIYECEPSVRTLSVSNKKGMPEKIRINLPYLYFVVRYLKDGCNFIYPSIFGSGLHLYASVTQINSFEDEICVLPTDIDGMVCLDHRYDYIHFSSKEKLASNIIAAWFGSSHDDQAYRYANNFLPLDENYCWDWNEYPFNIDWSKKLVRNQFCYRLGEKILTTKFGDSLASQKYYQKYYGVTNQIAPHILAPESQQDQRKNYLDLVV